MAHEINCLDIGTSKVNLLTGRLTASGPELKGFITVPSRGIRKGLIIDMTEASSSIKDAIKEAEKRYSVRVDSVVTAISGSSIQIIESYGATGTGGKKITERDIQNAISSADSVYIPLDREVLHVIPVEFFLDGESGIKNPLGMKGFRLEVKVQIITALINPLENLSACCEQAGLRIKEFIFKPIALQKAILKDEEIEEGVLLVDIGGGTTDISVFKDRRLLFTKTITVGGNHITNDLAIGLKIPVQEAERLKIKYGSAVLRNSSDEIEIDSLRNRRTISLGIIEEIIYARSEELISLIKDSIKGLPGLCGVVITGGSSVLNGLDNLIESLLGMPVRIGCPEGFRGPSISSAQPGPQDSLVFGLWKVAIEGMKPDKNWKYLIGDLIKKAKVILNTPRKLVSELRTKRVLTSEHQ
ncbi:MAG: cell division protein FtsA [Thermodesulfovibrionales bacterium]